MNKIEQSFDHALCRFLERAQAVVNEYYASTFPNNTVPKLSAEPGKRYVRVVRHDGVGRSAHCFVDTTNGNVLKPAGWKGPAKGARGNIYSEKLGVGPHGALYAR